MIEMKNSGLCHIPFSLIVTNKVCPEHVVVESATKGFPQILPASKAGARFLSIQTHVYPELAEGPFPRIPVIMLASLASTGPHAYKIHFSAFC